jgi:glucosamine-6-phosphate deaminase
MINQLNVSCRHVHTFNMDEYADENGNTAPADHPGGFQYWMWRDLFHHIKPELAIPPGQIHFPSTANIGDYTLSFDAAARPTAVCSPAPTTCSTSPPR